MGTIYWCLMIFFKLVKINTRSGLKSFVFLSNILDICGLFDALNLLFYLLDPVCLCRISQVQLYCSIIYHNVFLCMVIVCSLDVRSIHYVLQIIFCHNSDCFMKLNKQILIPMKSCLHTEYFVTEFTKTKS